MRFVCILFVVFLVGHQFTKTSSYNEDEQQLENIIDELSNKISNEKDVYPDDLGQESDTQTVYPTKLTTSTILTSPTTTKQKLTTSTSPPNKNPSTKVVMEYEHTNSWTMFFILCILGKIWHLINNINNQEFKKIYVK